MRGGVHRGIVTDDEPLRFATARARQQCSGSGADRLRGAQIGGGFGRSRVLGGGWWFVRQSVVVSAHSLNPRPLAFFSSSESGTGPGVK